MAMLCYGVDDRGSISDRSRNFSRHSVQADSGAHPASNPMGIDVKRPGREAGRGMKLTTHP